MLTTLWLMNTLLADPRWNLYHAVFPDDADGAMMAMAGEDGLAECVGDAIRVCEHLGGHRVCSFCFIAQPGGSVVCSFTCGNPAMPSGCATPPPCPPWPAASEAGLQGPDSLKQED